MDVKGVAIRKQRAKVKIKEIREVSTIKDKRK